MAKIKIDDDHKPLDNAPLGQREYEDGGWYQFERWAGVSWFNGHSDYKDKERYGTKRDDTSVRSRFPVRVIASRQGGIGGQTSRFEDCDE